MKFKVKKRFKIFFIIIVIIILVSCNKKDNKALRKNLKTNKDIIVKKKINNNNNNNNPIENKEVNDVISMEEDNKYIKKISEEPFVSNTNEESSKKEIINTQKEDNNIEEKNNVLNVITSDIYNVEEKENKKILTGMNEGTLLGEIKEKLKNDNNIIKIYNEDVELEDTEVVKTGEIVKIEVDGEKLDEAIIILKGDINCDGRIDITDKTILKKHILNQEEITDYKKYAGDIVSDNIIDKLDLEKLENYILGKLTTLN